MTPDQAKRKQVELAQMVDRRPKLGSITTVAGVDISGVDAEGQARAAVVVLSYPGLELVEDRVVVEKVAFPYVPGLLSFREAPLIVAACEHLETDPDLVLVDGQGLAHPRRFGLGCHLGLIWEKPTIGCAKSKLCGEHEPVSSERGSYSEIMHKGEVIGAAVRTRTGVKPVYVSIGHMIDLTTAISCVLQCCRGLRLPEPTRLAHLLAGGRLKATTPSKPV
jgi:deoxyribonuclease V